MKKLKLITFLSLICFSFLMGQGYQTVNSNRIALFDNNSGNVKCIRIDSAKYQTDSIFYPSSNIQQLDYDCFTPYGSSWIGDKCIIQGNGNNIFFNKDKDSIKIKTNALLGEIWTVYELKDSTIVQAEVIKYDTLRFIGQLDSVKTISFQVFDKNMNPMTYDLNNMTLLLSKNYGFLRAFNFYLFPNYQIDYPHELFEEFDLIGLSNPKIGIQNLTRLDVFDFQIGDELHVLNEESSWGLDYSYSTTIKTIYKYLARTDYQDSILYVYSRKQSILTNWIDSNSFIYYNDTLKAILKPDSLFDSKLPGEPIISDHEAYSFYMTKDANISKTKPSEYGKIWPSHDTTCWINCCVDGCFPSYTYIKGLGGPYYQCDYSFNYNEKRELVYFKKGENTWGTPLLVTSISENMENKNIIIFPNPANDFINIQILEFKSKVIFELIDINGSIILSKTIQSNDNKINICDLKSGIYLYRLRDNNSVIKMDKIIIE